MSLPSSIIEAIQQDIVDRLAIQPDFVDNSISPLAFHPRDLASIISGIGLLTSGVSCIVGVIEAKKADPNVGARRMFWNDILVNIEFATNVALWANTQPTGIALAEIACGALGGGWDFDGKGVALTEFAITQHGVQKEEFISGNDAVLALANIVSLTCRTAGGLYVAGSTVATPVAAPSSGAVPQTVTLTCATPGAAIFYTTDGKQPSPLGASSTLYTAPIVIASAATLKARAWLAGYTASSTLTASYT